MKNANSDLKLVIEYLTGQKEYPSVARLKAGSLDDTPPSNSDQDYEWTEEDDTQEFLLQSQWWNFLPK